MSASAMAAVAVPVSSYVVVSPLRNEDAYLPQTIASMCAQTLKPRQWVLVDDGSTDRTGALIDEAAASHAWITPVHRRDRGFRQAGGGVIDAFYDGLAHLCEADWNVIVKLDGDLSFAPDYFARCLSRLQEDPRLGIVGGTCCVAQDGILRPEFAGEPSFHVRGPSKLYRRACFEAIGGLLRAPGWDTADQMKANLLGWTTRTFADIEVEHLRPTGLAYGAWSNWTKNGLANFVTGYDPLFMACKCLKRLLSRPTPAGLVEAAGLAHGYLSGHWRRVPRVDDPALIAYVRAQQRRALLLRGSLWREAPAARTETT